MSYRSICIAALLCAFGCSENPVIRDPNMPPRADAGDPQTVAFAGAPVDVLLDGSRSIDLDGRVIAWRWLSATRPPDNGRGRYVPPGEAADWPADAAQVMVRLPTEGVWRFSLQVIDDKLSTSLPDVVTITVGMPPAGAAGMGAGGMGAAGMGVAGMGVAGMAAPPAAGAGGAAGGP